MSGRDAWPPDDAAVVCPVCKGETCEDPSHVTLDPAALTDATGVAAEGRAIAETGIQYLVDGVIPNYGMVGMSVAFAKVGKTTFSLSLGAAVATGVPFLDRATTTTRVLMIAAEDPPEYCAYLARHLTVPSGRMTFYRQPIQLTADGLARIVGTVQQGQFGLVLIASWQSVIAGLLRDENDNAGSVLVVERAKLAARDSRIPWLIDAHSGKGEDQGDDADPMRALRGASSAAGAADYMLSLRYANGAFGTKRRLSGKGRFISLEPILMDFDPTTNTYTTSGGPRDLMRETTWRLICEMGALDDTPRSVTEIARTSGLLAIGSRITGSIHTRIHHAIYGRPEVGIIQTMRRGQKTTLYVRLDG